MTSPERIVAAQAEHWKPALNGSNTRGIIDGYVVPGDPFSRHAAGDANPVDLLIGYTSEEGVNWAPGPVTAAAFTARVERDFQPFAEDFLKLYPAGSDAEATRSNQRLEGERAFKWQAATWARLHQASGKGRVWFYRFSHTPGIGPFRRLGPGHGSELGHLFDFPRRGLRYGTQWPWNAAKDVALIDMMQGYWVNFARTGDPNGRGLPEWPAFAQGNRILELGDPVRAGDWPDDAEHRLMDRYMDALRTGAASSAASPD